MKRVLLSLLVVASMVAGEAVARNYDNGNDDMMASESKPEKRRSCRTCGTSCRTNRCHKCKTKCEKPKEQKLQCVRMVEKCERPSKECSEVCPAGTETRYVD